jgi:hypothetical protein
MGASADRHLSLISIFMSTDDNPIYIDIRSNLSYFFLAPPSPSSPPPVSSAPTAMQLLTAGLKL